MRCRTCGLFKIVPGKRDSQKELTVLPTLKSKAGAARKGADPINRMILLYRLRRERLHRRSIARTHEDLSLQNTRLVQYESYLDCVLRSAGNSNGGPFGVFEKSPCRSLSYRS